MIMRSNLLFITIAFCISHKLFSDHYTFFNDYLINNEINIYYINNNEAVYELIRDHLKSYGLKVNRLDRLDKSDQKLHIIFDAYYIPQNYFPENYIIYQTLNLQDTPLTKSYLSKLKNAVAVWDPVGSNLNLYSLLIDNYYFFNSNYINTYILPCLLPLNCLSNYKNILNYSNHKDTDISSHLPAIFSHCVLKNPKMVIELGVRSGESSFAFKNALDLLDSKLIGVDISTESADVYKNLNIKNSTFKVMDDLKFSVF